jgi:hypothetical protein
MRKTSLALVLASLAVMPALWTPARGQGPIGPQTIYARQRQIFIPFDPDPNEAHRLKQLRLYYSIDQGRTWHPGPSATPDQRRFSFLAEGDGFYLFAVQTTDTAGRNFPERMEGIDAGLRVVIDTMPPVIILRPLPPRGNEVGVAWEIRDDNPDLTSPDAVRLEYRVAGNSNWQPLYRVPGTTQQYWSPGTSGVVEVRLRAFDRAGNSSEAVTQVSLSNPGGFVAPGYSPGNAGNSLQNPANGLAIDSERKYLNTTHVSLSYEITEKGPSGISSIDMWYITPTRGWNKYPLAKEAFKDTGGTGTLTFDVQGEGVYGFTLLPRSGVDTSAPPPLASDRPHLWIEVDLTKPVVELQSVLLGKDENKGKLLISWLARDKNLGEAPITLSYAADKEGPWTPFAPKLPNTGRYVWTMNGTQGLPWQFYIRVEAVDRAGNVGEAMSGLVKVDTVLPKAKIIDVHAGGR